MMEGLGKALANSRKEAEEEEEEQTCWKCAAFVSAVFAKSHTFLCRKPLWLLAVYVNEQYFIKDGN